MDAKYLAEIKARAEGAAVHEYDGITDLIYGRDVKALLSDNAAKDQQIATLKKEKVRAEKALELALTDLDYHTGYSASENIIIRNEAIHSYIRQAQEQEGQK